MNEKHEYLCGQWGHISTDHFILDCASVKADLSFFESMLVYMIYSTFPKEAFQYMSKLIWVVNKASIKFNETYKCHLLVIS